MYLKKIASELLRINAYYALTYDKSYNTYTRGTSKCAVMDLTYLFAERFDVSKTVRREVYNWLVGRNKATAEELAELVILYTPEGGEVKLGDIARIKDKFEKREERMELDGLPAGLLIS